MANKYEKMSDFISHQVNVFENQEELQQYSHINGLPFKSWPHQAVVKVWDSRDSAPLRVEMACNSGKLLEIVYQN